MARTKTYKNTVPPVERLPDWRQLIGYGEALIRLQQMAAADSLPAFLLLEGRPATGKAMFAAAVAAVSFCQTGDACGRCAGCEGVLLGSHDEILWLDGRTQPLQVSQAAALQDHLSYQPIHGRHRVAVVIDADQATAQAQNRLLKTLEEPPEHARIIFTTGRSGALLTTVLSRALRWPLLPPDPEKSLDWLMSREEAAGLSRQQCRDLLVENGLAPGAVLAKLTGSEEDEEKVDQLIFDLITAAPDAPVSRLSENLLKLKKLDANELACRAEVILNRYYKGKMSSRGAAGGLVPVQAIAGRRQILRQVRQVAGRGRVALNTRLVAEALGMAGPV